MTKKTRTDRVFERHETFHALNETEPRRKIKALPVRSSEQHVLLSCKPHTFLDHCCGNMPQILAYVIPGITASRKRRLGGHLVHLFVHKAGGLEEGMCIWRCRKVMWAASGQKLM